MTRAELVDALCSPAALGHPIEMPRVVETHISYVLLTGSYAYKLKKAVDLGFLDFSTLALRKHFCEEELRLNRRLAPELYLEVVPICGSEQAPVVGGPGPAIEYAVKMRQFDGRQEVDRLLAAGAVGAAHIDRLAADLAAFHDGVDVAAADSPFGERDSLRQQVMDNFEQSAPCKQRLEHPDVLGRLRAWTETSLGDNAERFRQRKREGRVRECHGDLHAANMVMVDDRIVAFDCLEFSPRLRWIDTMSEIAFTLMDLDYRHRRDLSRRLLGRYLEHGGDYEGLSVLRHYLVYRAMVRAKVACIRMRQETAGDDAREVAVGEFRSHVGLAERYAEQQPSPWLAITHGLSGSGKTYVTDHLLERIDAIRVRSDIERKRLFGLAALARSGSALDAGLYTRDASDATYRRLAALAEGVVRAGYPVIVDATFVERERRDAFRRLAARHRIPFAIIDFQASREVLADRVRRRAARGADPSEATLEVLARQLDRDEPPGGEESVFTITVDSETEVDVAALARRLNAIA